MCVCVCVCCVRVRALVVVFPAGDWLRVDAARGHAGAGRLGANGAWRGDGRGTAVEVHLRRVRGTACGARWCHARTDHSARAHTQTAHRYRHRHTHARTRTRTRTRTNTQSHANTQTRTHTHTHLYAHIHASARARQDTDCGFLKKKGAKVQNVPEERRAGTAITDRHAALVNRSPPGQRPEPQSRVHPGSPYPLGARGHPADAAATSPAPPCQGTRLSSETHGRLAKHSACGPCGLCVGCGLARACRRKGRAED